MESDDDSDRRDRLNRKRLEWTPIEMTEEEMSTNWRKFNTRAYANKTAVHYYCAKGRKGCPRRIKKEIYRTGQIEYLTNGMPHENHGSSSKAGLTPEQKQFVLNAQIQKPNDLLRLFKLEGIPAPPKRKLKGFLQRMRAEKRGGNLSKIKIVSVAASSTGLEHEQPQSSPIHDHADDGDDHFEESEPVARSRSPSPVSELKHPTAQVIQIRKKPSNESSKTRRAIDRSAAAAKIKLSAPKSKLVSLKWENQLKQLQTALKSMFDDLRGGQALTDVTLVSSEGDEMVEVHHVVLSMCSPYFQRLFKKVQGSKKAVGNMVVVLDHVKISHLKSLVQFIYTGQVHVPTGEVSEFRRLCDQFEIQGLCFSTSARTCSNDKSKSSGNRSKSSKASSFSGSYNYSLRTRTSENNFFQEDDEESNDNADDSFDNFRTPVSEDEDGQFSEPEMKAERASCDENDSDHSGYDAASKVNDEYNDNILESAQTTENKNLDSANKSANQQSLESTDKSKNEKPIMEPMVNPRTGILETEEDRKRKFLPWREIDPLPSEVMKEHWAMSHKRTRKGGPNTYYVMYYCRHGYKRCPAQLKIETFLGRKLWYVNGLEHAYHRTVPHGLVNDQKEFIDELLKRNIRTPMEILKAIQEDGRLRVPTRIQVRNYLRTQRSRMLDQLETLTGQKLRTGKRGRPSKEESLSKLLSSSPKSSTVKNITRRFVPNQELRSPASSLLPESPNATSSLEHSEPTSASIPTESHPHPSVPLQLPNMGYNFPHSSMVLPLPNQYPPPNQFGT